MKNTLNLLKCTYRNKLLFTIKSTTMITCFYFLACLISKSNFSFRNILFVLLTSFIFTALLSIAISQYKDFKISMQLGFSRSNLWKTKLIEFFLQSIIIIGYALTTIKVQTIYSNIIKLLGTIFSVSCIVWVVISTLFALSSLLALYKKIGKLLVAAGLYFSFMAILNLSAQNHIILLIFNKIFNLNFYVAFFSISIIWTLIMLLISYILTLRTQIRRS